MLPHVSEVHSPGSRSGVGREGAGAESSPSTQAFSLYWLLMITQLILCLPVIQRVEETKSLNTPDPGVGRSVPNLSQAVPLRCVDAREACAERNGEESFRVGIIVAGTTRRRGAGTLHGIVAPEPHTEEHLWHLDTVPDCDSRRCGGRWYGAAEKQEHNSHQTLAKHHHR